MVYGTVLQQTKLTSKLTVTELSLPLQSSWRYVFIDFEKFVRLGFYCKKIYKYSSPCEVGISGCVKVTVPV